MNTEDLEKQTPLIEAAAKNNASIADILLTHGANIESVISTKRLVSFGQHKTTPLMYLRYDK